MDSLLCIPESDLVPPSFMVAPGLQISPVGHGGMQWECAL